MDLGPAGAGDHGGHGPATTVRPVRGTMATTVRPVRGTMATTVRPPTASTRAAGAAVGCTLGASVFTEAAGRAHIEPPHPPCGSIHLCPLLLLLLLVLLLLSVE